MKRNNDFALKIVLCASLVVFAAMIITVIALIFGNFTGGSRRPGHHKDRH